ncbi:hypothetical protein [Acaryochloris sp. IP29b_bin.148]|uniref:metallophosphoesterase family protein n=1 Tax=Acaryochloris sp. IP29b_bin.148 TaxID=2969218 RepID=UPI0026113A43|nr:hypothetical protein [Acaryochloris sp. IP29b_bin.148]
MKLILLSNILEHPGFPLFIRDIATQYPGITFLVAGDLLNIFPEPGEDLAGSIYAEIYGLDHLQAGMNELITTRFKQITQSRFIQPLQQMFLPRGTHFKTAQMLAHRRYNQFFTKIAPDLHQNQCRLMFIPGNMDYPYLAQAATVPHREITQLDIDYLQEEGWKIGGLGGIPNTAHPFRGVVEISPYEMTEAEYQRRLHSLWGVDVLITHLSPEEYPPLAQFVQNSPLKVLICRAPFNFKRHHDYRGALGQMQLHNKQVIYIRPFEYPTNHFYLLTLDEQGIADPHLEKLAWREERFSPLSMQRSGS